MDISKKYADILNNSDISGLSEELKIQYIKYQYENNENDTLVLCNSLYEATTIYNNLRTYIDNVLLFPMDDFLTTMALAVSPELKVKRLETLNAIQHENKKLVITNLMGYLKFVPNKSVLQKMNITLNKNDKINRKSFEELIDKYGYTKTSIVTSTGEYSLRGYRVRFLNSITWRHFRWRAWMLSECGCRDILRERTVYMRIGIAAHHSVPDITEWVWIPYMSCLDLWMHHR